MPPSQYPKLCIQGVVIKIPVGTTWIVIEGSQLSFIGPQLPPQNTSQDDEDDEFYASDGFDEDSPDFF